MKSTKYIFILTGSLLIYILPEVFFENAMLYITGGIIGGSILEILKRFGIEDKDFLGTFIWLFFFVGVTLVFLKLKNRPLKYFTIVTIVFLSYVFDFMLFEILPSNIPNYYLVEWTRILSKGFMLSVIVYIGLGIYKKQETQSKE